MDNSNARSSLVMTDHGMSDDRYEVRVLRWDREKQVYWARHEDAGRRMLSKTHRFYQGTPGYRGTRLVKVSKKVAVEIIDEFQSNERHHGADRHYH